MGTKQVARSVVGQMGGEGWDTTTTLFLAKRKAFCWRCGGSTRIVGGLWQHSCWRR